MVIIRKKILCHIIKKYKLSTKYDAMYKELSLYPKKKIHFYQILLNKKKEYHFFVTIPSHNLL